jgi:hypothetical protein
LATAAAAVAAPLAGAASAATNGPVVSTVAQVPQGPLHLAVENGAFYVVSASTAEEGPPGTGLLTKVANGHQTTLVSVPNGEVAGVSVQHGRISYTTSSQAFVGARQLTSGGSVSIGNTLAFEKSHNPDGNVSYAFQGLSKSCINQLPKSPGGPRPYNGIIDSHPYSILDTGAKRFIADAAGNDILQVTSNGLKKLAVLPPFAIKVTADLAKAQHLPPCVAGHNYRFEPVPTDIELGPDGMLYATALTAAVFLGAPAGEVFQINPNTGATKLYASGFQGATGLAVTGNGTIYVAELFGNRISRVVNGHPTPFLAVNQPGDVEWDQSTKPGSLYATVNVLNPKAGTLLRIQP